MPSDPPDIAGYVRFQLDRLSQRDGAFEFQEICLYLGRSIISRNLIRSTGPVSSGGGGDQGRDVETFRGQLEDQTVVVACTLQQGDIKSKISDDVKKICSQGEPVDAIYAMCTAPVPIAVRHELQAATRSTYGVRLEVLDGEAIADSLADSEVFWIARRYLSVPEEMSPRMGDPQWYTRSRSRWFDEGRPLVTWGDLEEVRALWRHIVFSDGPREDLDRWHELLDELAMPGGEMLQRRAFYEQAVLQVRGLEAVTIREASFNDFFAFIESADDDGDLEDLQALISYLTTATLADLTALSVEALQDWRSRLEERIDRLLDEGPAPGRMCSLLGTSAALSLTLHFDTDEMPPGSLEGAIEKWTRILDYADSTVLYPIGRIASAVSVWTPLLSGVRGYAELTTKLDHVVRSRSGGTAAATNARDRAMSSWNAGDVGSALADFDRARVGWSVAGSFRGAVLALHMMARCYEKLGFRSAAKYSALAAAGITVVDGVPDDLVDLTPNLLMQVSQIEYGLGNWVSAAEFAELGIRAYDSVGIAPWEEDDEARDATFMCLFGPAGLALALDLPIAPYMRELADRSGVGEMVSAGSWDGEPAPNVAADVVNQLGAAPFADCGIMRSTSFETASGIWAVCCPNSYEAVIATERLVATLQILMSIPLIRDFEFDAERVVASVLCGENPGARRVTEASIPCWEVRLRPIDPGDISLIGPAVVETVGVCLEILSHHCLSGPEAFRATVEPSLNELFDRVTLGASYDFHHHLFLARAGWDQCSRWDTPQPDTSLCFRYPPQHD